MADRKPGDPSDATSEPESVAANDSRQVDSTLMRVLKWALVLFSLFSSVPAGITPQSWRLLAIFVDAGCIVRPIPAARLSYWA